MFTKKDFITTDRISDAFKDYYYKTDIIVMNRPIYWRERYITPPHKNLPLIITGHSDFAITDREVDEFSPKVWWTVNKQSPRVLAFPLGITNYTNESPEHLIYGNLDIMMEVMYKPKNLKNLVYMNFNIQTFISERQHVWDLFKDYDWVTKEESINSLEARKNFLEQIRNHTFTLCPRGNGIDTHRLWETLYMGGIPIVREDIAMDDFKDLPILFVRDWDQITPDFLRNQESIIQHKVCNLYKLKVDYWIEKIQTSSLP